MRSSSADLATTRERMVGGRTERGVGQSQDGCAPMMCVSESVKRAVERRGRARRR
jgi:hypothetical protein